MAKIDRVQEVSIDLLQPYENNAKIHGEDQVKQIAESIKEFGFISPCLIDKDYNIIAGHGRVMSAKLLGMTEVPCLFIEGLTEAQRKAYILADNRLTELGEWDFDKIQLELEELADLDFNISLTGFEFEENEPYHEPEEETDEYEDIDKLEKHYGVPYQGNKSRIADIIVSILPQGRRLVDLFGGGGAITHCAMLNGKWEYFLYNDLNEMITTLFVDAIYGKYHDERRVITRQDFEELKDSDPYVKYIWSFGNNGTGYLWGKEIEDIKCQACRVLLGENPNERRLAYRQFIAMLKEQKVQSMDRIQSVEHLQALTQLEALQRLEVKNIDYRDFEYQEGDTVYCDVPYEQVDKNKCDDYGLVFDSIEFYKWAKSRPYQIFFSSYEISDKDFYSKKVKDVALLIGANTNGQKRTEYLYSNKPF